MPPRTAAELRPGDHLCCIYASEDERRDSIVPYLRLGLERGEKLLYIADTSTAATVTEELRAEDRAVDDATSTGRFEILTSDETYLRDGAFDPDAMIDLLRESIDAAAAAGYPLMRATGEMSWNLRGLPGSERLIEYEERLNDLLPGRPAMALCQYDRSRFSAATLLDVLRTHPFVAVGDRVLDNPYYVPPSEFFGVDRTRSDLDGWLRNLADRREQDEARARATEALRESERRFRTMLETIDLIGVILDAEGSVVFCNDHLLAITGWDWDEVVGRSWFDVFIPPEARQVLRRDVFDAIIASGTMPAQAENEILTRGGERRLVAWNNTALRDAAGTVEGVASIGQDVTDARRAEADLVRTRRLLDQAQAVSHVGGWEYDLASGAIAWTDETYRIHGLDRTFDASRVSRDITFYSPDSVPAVAEAFRRACEEGVAYDLEAQLDRADGRRIWVRTIGTPVMEDGRVVRVYGDIVDITERKQAVDELRASESRFRTLVESAADAIFITDGTGDDARFVDVNPAGCALLGLRRDQILSLGWSDVVRPAPGELAEHAAIPEGERILVDRRLARRDGADVEVEASATRLPDGRTLAIVRDVTERNRMREQISQWQKMETVGRLAGGVAHDFNNLLAVVIGNAEFAADGLAEDDPRRAAIADIQDAAQRGAALTRQLLAFSRRQHVDPETLSIDEVVEDTRLIARRLVRESIALEVVRGSTGRVHADRAQLGQILMNLVVNARDAMPTGGTITVETCDVTLAAGDAHPAALSPGRYVAVAVTDTGCGIEEARRAAIFEPFYTTKPAGHGTGLGLSTAQGIARQAGGELVLARTAVGEGSSFVLYLPVVEGGPERSALHDETAVAGTGTILLVEDDPGVRRLAERILTEAGYSVLTAEDGAEALRRLDEVPDDGTIVTDVIMPRMGGVELAQEVAARRPALRVVFTSGYPGEIANIDESVPSVTGFVTKPYTAATLTHAVHDARRHDD